MPRIAADLVLFLIAVVWGGTFPVIKVLVEGVSTNYLLALRFSIAFVAMVPFIVGRRRWDGRAVWPGIFLGLVLWGAYGLQTWGLNYTSASKAGFLTGLSVLMVPGMAAVWLRKKPTRAVVLGAVLATSGMGLLSIDLSAWNVINPGDLLVIGCAFLYALQIVLIDRYTSRVDSVQLAWVEIGTVAVLSGFLGITLEPVPTMTGGTWLGILYLAVLATAIAQTAQITVQRFTTPARVALLLSLEPVFAALFASAFLGEILAGSQLLGGVLVMAGILIAELDPWRSRNGQSHSV